MTPLAQEVVAEATSRWDAGGRVGTPRSLETLLWETQRCPWSSGPGRGEVVV